MANTFTNQMVAILSGALSVLRDEATLPKIVGNNFSGEAAQKGQVINVSIPAAQAATAITPAATPPALVDKVPGVAQITLSNWDATRFHMTTKELGEVLNPTRDFILPQIAEAARALLYNINATLFATYKKAYGYAGTAGTNPFYSDWDTLNEADKVLLRQLCPRGNRYAVVDANAAESLKNVEDFFNASFRGQNQTVEQGIFGSLGGFKIMADQQVPTHTAGTITTGLIAKAGTAVVAGLKTFLVTTAASTGACALLEGDVISIAGHTTTYTLTAACTEAVAAADEAILFEPGLERALVGSEAITVKGTHVVNLAFDASAFGLAMRVPGDNIDGAPTIGPSVAMVDPVTGIPLKLNYLPGYHSAQWELSALWGCQMIDPRRVCRIAG